jgi:NAD(P)-dependent dehydrogenase (short-subunit alcohol dehydrogenase family)
MPRFATTAELSARMRRIRKTNTKPELLVRAVAFLVAPESSFVTAQVLTVVAG